MTRSFLFVAAALLTGCPSIAPARSVDRPKPKTTAGNSHDAVHAKELEQIQSELRQTQTELEKFRIEQ